MKRSCPILLFCGCSRFWQRLPVGLPLREDGAIQEAEDSIRGNSLSGALPCVFAAACKGSDCTNYRTALPVCGTLSSPTRPLAAGLVPGTIRHSIASIPGGGVRGGFRH